MTCLVCAKGVVAWFVRVDDQACPDSVRGTWLERCGQCHTQLRKYWKRVTSRTLAEGKIG